MIFPELRVLVTGGRKYQDYRAVNRAFSLLPTKPALIIHGAARGADTLAERWAQCNGVPTLKFPADWTTHRKSAGPIRNRHMLKESNPDLVIAFPGGPGTADMVSIARRANVPVVTNTQELMDFIDLIQRHQK